MKRLILLFIVFFILTGCSYNEGPADESGQETEGTETEENVAEKGIKIESVSFPKGSFNAGEEVRLSITISNYDDVDKNIWIETVLNNAVGKKVETENKQISLKTHEVYKTVETDMRIKSEIETGKYTIDIRLWEGNPLDAGSNLISKAEAEETIIIYHNKEEFDSELSRDWKASDKNLGRTELKTSNISITESMLSIIMPSGRLEGGEISTISGKGYGIYEARLKVPYAPSSITGFFMYEVPDFYYEIDMEIYNDKNGKILITTYADGKARNKYTGNLGFDPGGDFHDYRIEYFEESLSFYVDGTLIIRWLDGYPKHSMRLMVNSWYPTWLAGTPPLEEQKLFVDHIRY